MDLATILGIIISFGLVLMAILTSGSIFIFIDVPSLMIVIGGTLGCCFTNYPIGQVIRIIGIIKKTFAFSLESADVTIARFMDYANKARKEGILALEGAVSQTSDPFIAKGLQLIIDGMEADSVREVMELELASLQNRHQIGIDLLNTFATFAPAMGMIGTVIGLVQMLQNMSDPSSIGPAMAVALLTTFYGAILANLIFTPLSGKLKIRDQEEMNLRELQIVGLLGIALGENPRILLEKMNTFQPPTSRTTEV